MGRSLDSRHPPVLRTQFMRNMGVLLLINFIPVLGGIYFLVQIFNGRFQVRHKGVVVLLGLMILIALVLLFFWWVLLPIAQWLKDWPWWHAVNRSMVIWIVPSIMGFAVWAVTFFACIMLGGVVFFVLFAAVARTIAYFA